MVLFPVNLDAHRAFETDHQLQRVSSKFLGYWTDPFFAKGFNLGHLAPDLVSINNTVAWTQSPSTKSFAKEFGVLMDEVGEFSNSSDVMNFLMRLYASMASALPTNCILAG